MITTTMIVFGILLLFFFLGMIGDKNPENRKNYTYAFCILAVSITLLAALAIFFNYF